MAYESCPKCGNKKHQLMACSSCAFQRNPIHNHKQNSLPTKKANDIKEVEENKIESKSNESIKCPICLITVKKKNLQKHIKKVHEEKKQDVIKICPRCGARATKEHIERKSCTSLKNYNKKKRVEYIDSYSKDDIFNRGIVVSGGGFGVGKGKNK